MGIQESKEKQAVESPPQEPFAVLRHADGGRFPDDFEKAAQAAMQASRRQGGKPATITVTVKISAKPRFDDDSNTLCLVDVVAGIKSSLPERERDVCLLYFDAATGAVSRHNPNQKTLFNEKA